MTFTTIQSSLGWVLVAATEKGVAAVQFGDRRADLRRQFLADHPSARQSADGPLRAWGRRVLAGIEGAAEADMPLDLRGTEFQKAVWRELQRIPLGQTRTYAQVASAIGRPGAVRAVGQACGANPIGVLVPCHRVVRSDGGLGGYYGGVSRKKELLRRERAAC